MSIETQPILDHYRFVLSSGEEQVVHASQRAPKRVIAGAGTLHLNHEPFETGKSVVIDSELTVQGPGVVFVQDTKAKPRKASTDKPKRKAKRTKES